ncbi:MAG: peptidylprolyl isomerase [Thermoanaerobaculia bacterium]
MSGRRPRAFSSRWLIVGLAGWLVTGCASVDTESTRAGAVPGSASEAVEETLGNVDAEALLLLMSDRLLFEPFGVARLFRERPEFHERLAVTLGRVGDGRGLSYLESMMADPVVEVRRAAAFGLGLLGDPGAYPSLLAATVDPDREVGQLAVGALARLESPLSEILPALEALPEAERRHRLLPSLFRFPPDDIHRAARELGGGQSELPSELGRWLHYALARSGDARGLSRLRASLDSADPWVRGWAARALGRLGVAEDLERLEPLLAAEDAGVVVQALRAASALVGSGRVAAGAPWLEALERLVVDPRPWVRLTALEVAGARPLSTDLAAHLRQVAAGEGHGAGLALVSLARAGDIESQQLVLRASASADPGMRRAAVAAAGLSGPAETIDRAWTDSDVSVRMAALSVFLEGESLRAERAAREALLEPDPGLRARSLDWLAAHAVAPLDELLMAISTVGDARLPDVKVNAAAALMARAESEPLERGASIAAIERLASDESYLVRRAAGRALETLKRPVPALGTVPTSRTIRTYREIARSTERSRWVELEVAAGIIVLELDCPTAPLTCLSFLQLAGAGYFDGLRFHRVIPDFVAQGGDPRGDGWGGPGFSLRDENSRISYRRGVVGMARSDTHTAGSQFFLALSAQPHLDGRYTAFGRVIEGDQFLDGIEQGDEIVAIREVERP